MSDNKKNTGDCNTGDCNTGDFNTGDLNTGDLNTGSWNTGDRNTGDRNTGNWNTGDLNTGDLNTGDCNTGDFNTGDFNTGDCNTGDRNTGNWNTGDRNTGYCNTITPDECLIFNKIGSLKEWEEADKPDWMFVDLTEWVYEEDMTDKEKEANPTYATTGGYLKFYSSLQHAYIEAWEKADEEDRAKTFKLPNFDIEVFKEIFGFTPKLKSDDKVKITVEGKDTWISRDSAKALNLID